MKKFEIFILILALTLSASTAQAAIYNNGAVNDISSAITGSVTVYDNPSPPPLTTTVNLKPGAAIEFSLNAYNSSILNLYDGSVGTDLSTSNTSNANIYGGTIGGNIYAWETSTINIYGQDFFIDGSSAAYGPVTADFGTLTGTLHNGDLLSVMFARMPLATGGQTASNIVLHDMEIVPLPGAAILGALGMITAGWRLRKRKTA